MTPAPLRDLRSPFWLWGPVLLQMALIFGASSISNLGELPGGMSDKSGHSIGYAMLGGLLLRALAGGRLSGITWRVVLAAIGLATLYGVSDEVHQMFVPGRTSDGYDVLADAIGATIAVVGGWLVRAVRR